MSALGALALAGVGLSLAGTLVIQVPPLHRRLLVLDLIPVLPRWAFFAFGRGTRDLEVLVRDVGEGGAATGWSVVSPAGGVRPSHALWRPSKHEDAIVGSAAAILERRLQAGRPVDGSSRAFRLIQHRCSLARPAAGSAGRQFALRVSRGRKTPDTCIIFISPVFPP